MGTKFPTFVKHPTRNWFLQALITSSYLPLKISKKQFVITNSPKGLASTVVIVLHLAVVLKWFLAQWLNVTSPPSPTWNFVLMYYYLTLFSAVLVIIVHFKLVKEELVLLLNSALRVDQDYNEKGEFISKVIKI